MEAILEVRDLRVAFSPRGRQPVAAVDGVSFQLYPGEILGIVGESGSGKSTVARAVVRLEPASGGSIRIHGRDITTARGPALREVYSRIQLVFQAPAGSFDPRRTLGDGITEVLRNHGASRSDARQRAGQLLERCGLSAEFARRYPHEVSGGECQRAAIARALAAEPEILILDEATSALDATVQQQIMALLRALHKEHGLSYLFICHNLALVQSFCSRVLVMHAGKIVEEGAPDQIVMAPKSEYTKRLVDAAQQHL